MMKRNNNDPDWVQLDRGSDRPSRAMKIYPEWPVIAKRTDNAASPQRRDTCTQRGEDVIMIMKDAATPCRRRVRLANGTTRTP